MLAAQLFPLTISGLCGGACDEKAPNLFKVGPVGSAVPPTPSSLLPQFQKGLIEGAERGHWNIMSPLTPYSPGLPVLQQGGGVGGRRVGKGSLMSTSSPAPWVVVSQAPWWSFYCCLMMSSLELLTVFESGAWVLSVWESCSASQQHRDSSPKTCYHSGPHWIRRLFCPGFFLSAGLFETCLLWGIASPETACYPSLCSSLNSWGLIKEYLQKFHKYYEMRQWISYRVAVVVTQFTYRGGPGWWWNQDGDGYMTLRIFKHILENVIKNTLSWMKVSNWIFQAILSNPLNAVQQDACSYITFYTQADWTMFHYPIPPIPQGKVRVTFPINDGKPNPTMNTPGMRSQLYPVIKCYNKLIWYIHWWRKSLHLREKQICPRLWTSKMWRLRGRPFPLLYGAGSHTLDN